MDGKTTIEMDEERAKKFEAFCLIETIADGRLWKHTKTQIYPDGRVVIHIITTKDLTNEKK